MSVPIRIFLTGGTLDKQYHELSGALSLRNTSIFQMLEISRCTLKVTVESLMLMDSTQMTDEQRAQIALRCVPAPEQHIVITYGTDTMAETAGYLQRQALRESAGKYKQTRLLHLLG
jgi:L-asparaginase